ncbi:MAG: hypothetical protein JWR37_1853 [Mycobacterium sp.]|nr:hypothetical protein [Mycobacterium sp.]
MRARTSPTTSACTAGDAGQRGNQIQLIERGLVRVTLDKGQHVLEFDARAWTPGHLDTWTPGRDGGVVGYDNAMAVGARFVELPGLRR